MVQFASYLRRVLCKTRLIVPRINGPIVSDCDFLQDSVVSMFFFFNIVFSIV